MLLLSNTESDEGHKTKILNIVMYATANKLIKREKNIFYSQDTDHTHKSQKNYILKIYHFLFCFLLRMSSAHF